ncbi:transposable element Tcb1 transposase [Trichonephila clavipes]|nr:transposable element Tcb1 transposase [Trichonephila clavipes]
MNRCPDLVVCLKRDLQCLRPQASLVLIYRPNLAGMKGRVDLAQPVNRTPDLCDESQFCISGNQSSACVRRRTHEEISPQCLKPTVKCPAKVMVWGCMSSHGVGRLHIVSGTLKTMDYIEILQNKLLPTARDLMGNQSWIF